LRHDVPNLPWSTAAYYLGNVSIGRDLTRRNLLDNSEDEFGIVGIH
jgi:hypothetical protein